MGFLSKQEKEAAMIKWDKKVSRKDFIKLMLSSLALLSLSGPVSKDAWSVPSNSTGRLRKKIDCDYDLVAATGADPYLITVKAVEKIGGMGKFVKKNDIVLVKPNIGWDRTPEQAANTNPQVVAALIDLSFQAGAKRVNVFDLTCNDAKRCYANSGIENTAKEHGANIYFPDEWNTVKAHFNYDSPLEGWPVLKDAIDCDVFINVPVLKNHGLTRLTLSMKNLMGVCGGNRGVIHQNIGEKLVDLTGFINPDLNVIDAYRMLVRNGPSGGNLADVKRLDTVIVSADAMLADLYACKLAGVDPSSVSYLNNAMARNFGITDIDKANILSIKV